MGTSISIKRVFLHTVIATLVLAALVGIYVFLFGSFRRTEAKGGGAELPDTPNA